MVLALALLKRDVRSGLCGVLRTAINPAILSLLTLFCVYVALEAWFASRIGLWRATLVKDTIVWAITSGIVLIFNFATAYREPAFFRKTIVATVKFALVVEFLLNFFVFSLLAELVMQPVLAFVGMLSVVAGRNEKHRAVKQLTDALLAIGGFAVFGFVLREAYLHWREFDREVLLELVLPVWMTIGLLPFVYASGSLLRTIQSGGKSGVPPLITVFGR